MSRTIKLSKGYDIKLIGEVAATPGSTESPKTYSIKPFDFKGLTPKLQVEIGKEVKAGSPLFFFKELPEVFVTSPVSGEVIEINRGEKRVILEIKILADSNTSYETFTTGNPDNLDTAAVKNILLKSGAWVSLTQRPFGKVADPTDKPKSIFISGFDSAPLAPDYNFILQGRENDFQAGINALKKLTDGKVYLNLRAGDKHCAAFTGAKGVETTLFDGPHPTGCVGVQIHHLDPIAKGQIVWTINPEDVANIGKLFTTGQYSPERTVALTGSEVNEGARKYYKLTAGASLEGLLKGNTSSDNNRIISGNVLTGTKINNNGYLCYYDRQVTVIPEGDEPEFMGWLIPTYKRPSVSKTFLSYLFPNRKYKVNTNPHGERRAFVMTGEYEKVTPMDLYPQFLLKAILASDLEGMEALGILEVVEEDLALCEFICTSKTPVQNILRKGLTLIEKEG